jgi:L-ribulose-5-phosphate 3-epimerase
LAKTGKVDDVSSEGTPLTNRIGFMQGTLLESLGDRIRAFPWDSWRDEFPTAQQYGFGIMEWTLGQDRILMNPLMSVSGRNEIRQLCGEFGISIPSLTADFIMEAPFYKASGRERLARLDVLGGVVEACADIGIGLLVLPLVRGGRLCASREIESLRSGLNQLARLLDGSGVVLAFESDFAPTQLASLVRQHPAERVGITYDAGSSASLGFDSSQEIAAYGDRIVNVHVNDWICVGGGVALRAGNANLAMTLSHLRRAGYQGNLILQTARAANSHAGLLAQYRAITATWWNLVVSDGFQPRI